MAFQVIQRSKEFRTLVAHIFGDQMNVFVVGSCDVLIPEVFQTGHTFGPIQHALVELV